MVGGRFGRRRSEGSSEGIRRIRRGFPEEKPSSVADELHFGAGAQTRATRPIGQLPAPERGGNGMIRMKHD